MRIGPWLKVMRHGFRRLLDDTKRLMKIDREVALSEVSDLSILRTEQRELALK